MLNCSHASARIEAISTEPSIGQPPRMRERHLQIGEWISRRRPKAAKAADANFSRWPEEPRSQDRRRWSFARAGSWRPHRLPPRLRARDRGETADTHPAGESATPRSRAWRRAFGKLLDQPVELPLPAQRPDDKVGGQRPVAFVLKRRTDRRERRGRSSAPALMSRSAVNAAVRAGAIMRAGATEEPVAGLESADPQGTPGRNRTPALALQGKQSKHAASGLHAELVPYGMNDGAGLLLRGPRQSVIQFGAEQNGTLAMQFCVGVWPGMEPPDLVVNFDCWPRPVHDAVCFSILCAYVASASFCGVSRIVPRR